MKTALALGTFDGVHRGHRAVLDLPENCKKIAVTFRQLPKTEDGVKALMTYEEKCRVLREIGIDEVVGLDFGEVCHTGAEDFLHFLKERFSPSFFSCGFNYRFGENAAGDPAMLADFCRKHQIELLLRKPVLVGETVVSSTMIRSLIAQGEVERANTLLTVPFSFSAEVIHGDARGRTLGFPTVNQLYPEELVPPRFGVYQSEVVLGEKRYAAITNIGIRPTFAVDYILSETFIDRFSGDLYGKKVRVNLFRFVRPERKFSSAEELRRQVEEDKKLILK